MHTRPECDGRELDCSRSNQDAAGTTYIMNAQVNDREENGGYLIQPGLHVTVRQQW